MVRTSPTLTKREDSMQRRRITLFLIFLLSFSTIGWTADIAILRAQIEKSLPRARGDVGVAIKHLESGAEVLVNAETKYPMASAFKLPILVELFYQRAAGRIGLDDRLEIQ